MGVRQNKQRVDDVMLPNWAENDAHLFPLIHMQVNLKQLLLNYNNKKINMKNSNIYMCACACVRVRVCVRACARACLRVRADVCVHVCACVFGRE